MSDYETDRLIPPDEFLFPFEPYPIQKDFMKQLYIALEDGKLGIFESPTGTVSFYFLLLIVLLHSAAYSFQHCINVREIHCSLFKNQYNQARSY